MTELNDELVGYFTDSTQEEPAYDPPHDAPCLVCWRPLTADDVRTISMLAFGAAVSVFFRVHRTCCEEDPETVERIEHAILNGKATAQ